MTGPSRKISTPLILTTPDREGLIFRVFFWYKALEQGYYCASIMGWKVVIEARPAGYSATVLLAVALHSGLCCEGGALDRPALLQHVAAGPVRACAAVLVPDVVHGVLATG